MHKLPLFPQFEKLNFNHKPHLDLFAKKFGPYSDYNFTSLWSYNVAEEIELSELNNNIIVRFNDYITSEPFYSIFGSNNISESVTELIKYALSMGLTTSLKLIPEHTIEADRNLHSKFNISEDRGNFDYVVSIDNLSQLKGGLYESKRRMINQFIHQYPNHNIVTLDPKNKQTHQDIISVFERWEKSKQKNRSDTEHELVAINRLLTNSHLLDLLFIGIHHNDELVGFSISEILPQGYSIGHFMKADNNFKRIFDFLYHVTAIELKKKGVRYLNIEQDLGLPNLMNAKIGWKPTHYLKKYIISPK